MPYVTSLVGESQQFGANEYVSQQHRLRGLEACARSFS
jgi:hypothetical protein